MIGVKRFNSILQDSLYQSYLVRNRACEKERIYCKHDIAHFSDVARIAYIINLEKELGYAKELIYVTAFLHDIGRFMEYEEQMSHEVASWHLAEELLKKYDFDENEISLIKQAILGHRRKEEGTFASLIYKADKLSRLCMQCSTIEECYWDKAKKNLYLQY